MIKNAGGFLLALLAASSGCDSVAVEAEGTYQGIVEFEERNLAFEYPGRLAQLWVERGDTVGAGQRLAAIDDRLEQATTRARASETDAARARVAVTEAGSRPEEKRALEARIRAADAAIRKLTDDLRRETVLLEGGVTPRAEVDDLRAELDRATAERDALAQNLSLLVKGPRREEVAALESQAEASRALLDAQRERAGRFELRAPIAGDVLEHHFWPGEFVAQGVPVVTLADTARPFADVFVPEAELIRVQLGEAARIRVDGLEVPLDARVEHIARHTEFTPRYLFSEGERPNLVVRVRVRVLDPERRLRAGLPARVQILPLSAAAVSRPSSAEGAGGVHAGE